MSLAVSTTNCVAVLAAGVTWVNPLFPLIGRQLAADFRWYRVAGLMNASVWKRTCCWSACSSLLEGAQKRWRPIAGIRKQVFEYDEVMNNQRRAAAPSGVGFSMVVL